MAKFPPGAGELSGLRGAATLSSVVARAPSAVSAPKLSYAGGSVDDRCARGGERPGFFYHASFKCQRAFTALFGI